MSEAAGRQRVARIQKGEMKMMTMLTGKTRQFWVVVSIAAALLGGCAKNAARLEETADLHFDMSVDAFRKGDLGMALRESLLAIEGKPAVPTYWNMLGIVYFAQRDFEKAENAMKTAVGYDKRYSEAYNNLGSLYIEMKKWDLAEANFREALKNPLYLNPEKAYTNLGYVYYRTGRMDEAAKTFQQALSFNSSFYLANIHLGRMAFEQKRYDVASQYLRKGVEQCPECQEAQFKLGLSLVKIKKADDAKKVFEAGYKQNADSFYGQKCREYYDVLAKGGTVDVQGAVEEPTAK